MNKGNSFQSRSELNGDFPPIIGFLPEKSIRPGSTTIKRWSAELFFELFSLGRTNLLFSSIQLEKSFELLYQLSETNEMCFLKEIIDSAFLYILVDLLLNDGKDEFNRFLKIHSVKTSLSSDLLTQLGNIQVNSLDGISEINDYIMKPPIIIEETIRQKMIISKLNEFRTPAFGFLLKKFIYFPVAKQNVSHCFSMGTNIQFTNVFHYDSPQYSFGKPCLSSSIGNGYQKKSHIDKQIIPNIACVSLPDFVNHATVSVCGNYILFSSQGDLYFSRVSGQTEIIYSMSNEISALSLSVCSEKVICADSKGFISLCDVETRKSFEFYPVGSYVSTLEFSRSTSSTFCVGTLIGSVYVYQAGQKMPIRVYHHHKSGITNIIMHPNSDYFITSSVDGTARLFSITFGTCLRLFLLPNKAPVSLKISNNGRMLFVVFSNGVVGIFDIGTSKILRRIIIPASLCDSNVSMLDDMFVIVDKNGGLSTWDLNEVTSEPTFSLHIECLRPIQVETLQNGLILVLGYSRD